MAAELETSPDSYGGRPEFAKLTRWYEKAKAQAWQINDLPWGELPAVPERAGNLQQKGRRNDMWRSVVTQQWQADTLACEMAAQLLNQAPDPEAKLYYTTLVQDESLHTEAWLKMLMEIGGPAEEDPHLIKLVDMVLEADTVAEKVFLMQVFFEHVILSRFKLIKKRAEGSVLGSLAEQLIIDDSRHHQSGVTYERILLAGASKAAKAKVVATAKAALPPFVDHALWRPKARQMVGGRMEQADRERIKGEVNHGIRLGRIMGLDIDITDVNLPFAL